MAIILRHRYIVSDVFAVPFHTKQGIGFHYFSRNSVSHVHKKVPIAGLKRFRYPQKFPFKPSKPISQTKPELVHEKTFQAPSTIKRQNPKRELFAGSVTMGAAPSPRHVPVPMFCIKENIN
ncbi:hypothetical protein EUTSA_v10000567mg [Eutrema salsugineum]|uniref:Uncharacterized protein n=1 Tax=Eutrema salsugineum TaxID=72664 RepID=V4LUJ7_EUTSA|nr:uncharacterized protein LOC18021728 [Eutrema salsugineum]ESQ46167.1 hypothetical protein EUTSA_v10000567mg [Eutrema salsugineum]